MSIGKTIRVYLAHGTPGGLLTAEIGNWTGHVVAAPRSDLGMLLKREEASRTGIYLLIGDDPDGLGGTLVYIGEGDDVSKRIAHHARPEDQNGKDFWDRVVVLTSKDANLTKAHARYLESRFIELARAAQRARLANGTAPPPIALPEADRSDMEFFIEQAKIILPVLGVNVFRTSAARASSASASPTDAPVDPSPIFELRLQKENILGTAQEIDGEFTILEGSTARLEWTADYVKPGKREREKLLAMGVLAPTADGTALQLQRPSVFKSPSTAGEVIAGRSCNGRAEWKMRGTGESFGDWQLRGVAPLLD